CARVRGFYLQYFDYW
nr:immunoglobulin heavy chain junction region [Macaca mulatta]MOX03860.1 immunoglobulin heavy chain junction region [Macaca mulatta]